MRLVFSIAICGVLSSALSAQPAHLTVAPAHPKPGSIVRLTLSGATLRGDSVVTIVGIRGSMAGEPLHFVAAGRAIWHAIGAVPVDGPDTVIAQIVLERISGDADTVRESVVPARPPATRPGKARRLGVARRFTEPLDTATEMRIKRETERALAIGRRAHASPPLWNTSFLLPRGSRITSRFGAGRVFNGSVTSRHLGVDFRGGIGAPVLAANRGVVALVDTFFLAGTVIYIDHGAGVVTGYFHLSKPLAAGDTVARGQKIGLVGATGRVTGAHLHWSARYGAITVDPLDLVALGRRWYGRFD
jgi:murein DD-endopeptidase MepM/ murein hydrolase activator NlpD